MELLTDDRRGFTRVRLYYANGNAAGDRVLSHGEWWDTLKGISTTVEGWIPTDKLREIPSPRNASAQASVMMTADQKSLCVVVNASPSVQIYSLIADQKRLTLDDIYTLELKQVSEWLSYPGQSFWTSYVSTNGVISKLDPAAYRPITEWDRASYEEYTLARKIYMRDLMSRWEQLDLGDSRMEITPVIEKRGAFEDAWYDWAYHDKAQSPHRLGERVSRLVTDDPVERNAIISAFDAVSPTDVVSTDELLASIVSRYFTPLVLR